MASGPRKADLKRWERDIAQHLQEFPRQYKALEHAMAAFGGDFDLRLFKEAFNTTEDIDAYNRVQAVERALSRVQNFVADLAIAGVKLAGLQQTSDRYASPADQAFMVLRDAGVISKQLCRRLQRAQEARSAIERAYVETPAGKVHQAALLIRDSARDFIGRYRDWIEPHLTNWWRSPSRLPPGGRHALRAVRSWVASKSSSSAYCVTSANSPGVFGLNTSLKACYRALTLRIAWP